MEVFLVRHTRVAVEPDICYGQLDVDVANSFAEEAAALKAQLPNDFEAVYSSPLSRCAKLATQLADDIQFNDLLKEYDFGDWEGLPWKSIDQTALDHWMLDFVTHNAPGGENLELLYQRFHTFIEQLRQQEHEKVLLVAHAGIIRCAWAYLVEVPLKNIFRIPVGFGEIFRFKLSERRERDRILQKR